jgi:5-methylthioadenosine/S-adenosylhomocysteine deaminase
MLNRRRFLGTLGTFAAAELKRSRASAAVTRKTVSLPPRRELLLQNAYIMTMDPELGDIAGGDVHIKNGAIVAVGKALKAPGAAIFDGQHMIVLPGLVDTHWHMWNTLLRSFAGENPDQGYFPTAAAFGKIMTPEDMYHGVRLGRGPERQQEKLAHGDPDHS